MAEARAYGIHFMVDIVYRSGECKSYFVAGQFSSLSHDWSIEASQAYDALITQVEAQLLQGERINKIHPPTILPI